MPSLQCIASFTRNVHSHPPALRKQFRARSYFRATHIQHDIKLLSRHNRYDQRVLETRSRCQASKYCYFYFCKQITHISLVKNDTAACWHSTRFLSFYVSSIFHGNLEQWSSTMSNKLSKPGDPYS